MENRQGTGIRVKGIRDGILLELADNTVSFVALLKQLDQELAQKRAFLKGSRIVLDLGSREVSQSQLTEIQSLLIENEMELWTVLAELEVTRDAARELGFATRLSGSNTDFEGRELDTDNQVHEIGQDRPGSREANALMLVETVRSGRSIYHEGHVTIVGDVNPGAEVIATGHVIVWGRLRGMVHAGAQGDSAAVICALQLTPTQLRIANYIAIAPEEPVGAQSPEMASVRDGQIVAEPWRV